MFFLPVPPFLHKPTIVLILFMVAKSSLSQSFKVSEMPNPQVAKEKTKPK